MPAFTRRQYAGAAAATTITAGINPSDTTCSLAATTGWPSTAAVPFYVVIDPGTSAEEKCSATISGSTLTLTRAQDDTSATSHSSGATIYPVFTANDADEANEVVAKLTTKGDLLATDGSALNRLAVGTNGQVLTADSSVSNGLVWALPKVLQVVSANQNAQANNATATYADTGLTATITPSSASSKILVLVSQAGVVKGGLGSTSGCDLILLRGASTITQFGYAVGYTNSVLDVFTGNSSCMYMDSPATTSATTYKTQFKNQAAISGVTVQVGNSVSNIVLLEISA